MDILKMVQAQGELDAFIMRSKGVDDYKLTDICLALMVEIGECANEDASFKYWKQNKVIDRTKLLEEFADIMAFVFSLSFYSRLDKQADFMQKLYDIGYEAEIKANVSVQFIELTKSAVEFFKTAEGLSKSNPSKGGVISKESRKLISKAEFMILDMLHLAASLGISKDELEAAYYAKNKKNYYRQNSGY